MSTPPDFTTRAASSIANVLPTPAVAPKKMRRRPRRARASAACMRSSSWSGSGRASAMGCYSRVLVRLLGIERKVQFQHIHARLAEDAEGAAFGGRADEAADGLFGQPAR